MFILLGSKKLNKEIMVEVNSDITEEQIKDLFIDVLGVYYDKNSCYYEKQE